MYIGLSISTATVLSFLHSSSNQKSRYQKVHYPVLSAEPYAITRNMLELGNMPHEAVTNL